MPFGDVVSTAARIQGLPFYVSANITPDGRVCVRDGEREITVDGAKRGLRARVFEAVQRLDQQRADALNHSSREFR